MNEIMQVYIWGISSNIFAYLQNEYTILGAFEVVNDDADIHIFKYNYEKMWMWTQIKAILIIIQFLRGAFHERTAVFPLCIRNAP